jgi:hypothetical protein
MGLWCFEGVGLSIKSPKLYPGRNLEAGRIGLTFIEVNKHTGSQTLVRWSVRIVIYLAYVGQFLFPS